MFLSVLVLEAGELPTHGAQNKLLKRETSRKIKAFLPKCMMGIALYSGRLQCLASCYLGFYMTS